MTTTLASLTARLQQEVPPLNGQPADSAYSQAVQDAVAEWSDRVPLRRSVPIAVAAGQSDYTVPTDFLRLVRLTSTAQPGGLLITPGGLVPTGPGYREQIRVNGYTLTILPAPAYSMTRTLEYSAAHLLDDDDAYPDLTPSIIAAVLLRAQARILSLQASRAAQQAMRAKLGDSEVDKTKTPEALSQQAAELNQQFRETIQRATGTVGMRGGR